MQTSLEAIANKAKKDSKHRFQILYGMLNVNLLTEAGRELNKGAAPGVDGITADDYAKDLEGNIRKIVEDLKHKRYHAKLVKREYIPKGEGKMRPLGLIMGRGCACMQVKQKATSHSKYNYVRGIEPLTYTALTSPATRARGFTHNDI